MELLETSRDTLSYVVASTLERQALLQHHQFHLIGLYSYKSISTPVLRTTLEQKAEAGTHRPNSFETLS